MTSSHAQGSSYDCPHEVRIGVLANFASPFVLTSEGSDGDEGVPRGLFVDWAREGVGATRCHPTVKFFVLPRLRAYKRLELGQLDFFLPTVPSVVSLGQFAFPMAKGQVNSRMAFQVTGASLWVRKGENAVQWDGTTLKGPAGFEVGVAELSPAEVIGQNKGWKLAAGKNPGNTVERLRHGRLRVILVSDLVVESFAPEVVAGLTRLEPSLERFEYQAAGSKAFVSRYPAFASEFWQGLCQAGRQPVKDRPGIGHKDADVCR